jgi:quercetin dioxygenase-like cupin family protein
VTTFYDEWLERSQRLDKELASTPVVARGKNVQWVETPHDYKVGMLIARQSGFPTQGGALMQAEIPAGCHTGKRRNGEEAIHILKGSGFAVVNGARYDFKAGTTLHMPYMAERQFFNTGSEPVVYVAAATIDMDFDTKLGRLEQLEEKGKNSPDVESKFPAQTSQFAPDGRRIALHLEDAPDENKRREAGHHGHKPGQQAHRHGAILILMGGSESPSDETNGFQATAVAMSNIFEEVAGTSSHKHQHTEAMLYVLEGTGYSEIDGKRYDWVQGDAVHVPPRMTVHEHFNASDQRTRTLRVEFGIRYFYESLWDGYHKIEIREHAQKIQPEAAPVPAGGHRH